MQKKAEFWEKIKDNRVKCNLCYQSCIIDEDDVGFCGVRKNLGGSLYSMIYGSCSSVAVDPIEKKPLYHFHPGSSALSLGTVGCNFSCLYCQNSTISRASPDDFPYMQEFTSDEIIKLAKQKNCDSIAWTYNEPSIWFEFSYDTAKLANKQGIYNVYVSNGFIQEKPLREISPYLDAMNIDVKAFNDDFYKEICGARLKPVLHTCKLAKKLGIHLEVTYLVIPTFNDSEDEIKEFANWVVDELGDSTPVHFSRFHPDYKMKDASITPMDTMKKAYNIAKDAGLLYPFLGNVPTGEYDSTQCPRCGNICINRMGYSASMDGLNQGKCAKCGTELDIII